MKLQPTQLAVASFKGNPHPPNLISFPTCRLINQSFTYKTHILIYIYIYNTTCIYIYDNKLMFKIKISRCMLHHIHPSPFSFLPYFDALKSSASFCSTLHSCNEWCCSLYLCFAKGRLEGDASGSRNPHLYIFLQKIVVFRVRVFRYGLSCTFSVIFK